MTGKSAGIATITDHQADVEALVANLDDTAERSQRSYTPTPDIVPQGQRHNTLVRLAGTMWRRGMTVEAIEAAGPVIGSSAAIAAVDVRLDGVGQYLTAIAALCLEVACQPRLLPVFLGILRLVPATIATLQR